MYHKWSKDKSSHVNPHANKTSFRFQMVVIHTVIRQTFETLRVECCGKSRSSTRKDFNYRCHLIVQKRKGSEIGHVHISCPFAALVDDIDNGYGKHIYNSAWQEHETRNPLGKCLENSRHNDAEVI